MGGVMQWLRENVLPKLRSWGKMFALSVQWVREKGAQGVGWIATFVLGAGALFFAWLAYSAYSGLEVSPENQAHWALEFLKFYAYAAGGIILIWQVRIANRRATALEKTAALGEKGNTTERFKNAIEHLANASEPIRIGGIYGLYHVAREASEYVDTVLKILYAHAKLIMADPEYTKTKEPSNEMAAILDVLFPIIPDDENQKIEVLFEKVNISGWHLEGADLQSRHMKHVDGPGVNLTWANLRDANLSRARLHRAKLHRAKLANANLLAANFFYADLVQAELEDVDLSKAILSGANLKNAYMSGAHVVAEQLLNAETLYKAHLNDCVREEILRRKPKLLDDPDEEE